MSDSLEIKPADLEPNMQIELELETGESKKGFFKRFMHTTGDKKNIYSVNLQELCAKQNVGAADCSLFVSNMETDPRPDDKFKPKLFSEKIEHIKTIRLVPRNDTKLLLRRIQQLETSEREMHDKVQQIAAKLQKVIEFVNKKDKKLT